MNADREIENKSCREKRLFTRLGFSTDSLCKKMNSIKSIKLNLINAAIVLGGWLIPTFGGQIELLELGEFAVLIGIFASIYFIFSVYAPIYAFWLSFKAIKSHENTALISLGMILSLTYLGFYISSFWYMGQMLHI